MSDWREIVVHAPAGQAEHVCAALEACGALSITYQDDAGDPILEPPPGATPLWPATRVIGLFAAPAPVDAVRRALRERLGDEPRWEERPLPDRDWTLAWADHFRPMRFGSRLWVIPSDHPPPADGIAIRLDPGLAFGTGTHPTTALCLTWLDHNAPRLQGAHVIDYGCGSGILAIAAARLGAARVDAIDIDPQALTATADNAAKNGVADRIHLHRPEAPVPAGAAHVLLANILANPLKALAPRLSALLAADGHLVLSGILTHQAEAVAEAYRIQGFAIVRREDQEEWTCLHLSRA